MGLDINGVRLQLVAKQLGADFKHVVTIGRQGLNLTQQQLKKEFADFDIPYTEKMATEDYTYSEAFFSRLGAQTTQSIDNSNYEDATIIHDMNSPLSAELKGKFSVVVDAGTLEHVFNFPTAIKNCMELLASGGHFISITPANNFMGHGFYQFSPELFFSVFTQSNGFELTKLLICEIHEDSRWYEVSRPKGGNKGRVTLINNQPTYLMCIARRIDEACEPFSKPPQQSDYVEAWGQLTTQSANRTNIGEAKYTWFTTKAKTLIKRYWPSILPVVRVFRYFHTTTYSPRDYIPIDIKSYVKNI